MSEFWNEKIAPVGGERPWKVLRLTYAGVSLTPSESEIVRVLDEARGEYIPTRVLAYQALGFMVADDSEEELVRQHIKHIRRKVGSAEILSERGIGYALAPAYAVGWHVRAGAAS